MISIIVPYLSNSRCIDLFKNIIKENTISKYELIEIIDNTDVYAAFNEGVKKANGNIIILLNDDMFVCKGWDELYIKYAKGKTLVTGYLVEPGVIPVSSKNINKNFGKNPESYGRFEFEHWAEQIKTTLPESINGKGWYMPMAMEKKYFIEYPNEIKYPYPNDVLLIDNILEVQQYSFKKVASLCYHLQAFSTNKTIER